MLPLWLSPLVHCNFTLRFGGGGRMESLAFASSGRGALKAPLVLQTMESENPLPEERKRMIEKWYEALQQPGYECIFDDALPPESEYQYELTPLANLVPRERSWAALGWPAQACQLRSEGCGAAGCSW